MVKDSEELKLVIKYLRRMEALENAARALICSIDDNKISKEQTDKIKECLKME